MKRTGFSNHRPPHTTLEVNLRCHPGWWQGRKMCREMLRGVSGLHALKIGRGQKREGYCLLLLDYDPARLHEVKATVERLLASMFPMYVLPVE
jgi:hypothetical protein